MISSNQTNSPAELFNCRRGFEEPNWADYEYLVLGGCITDVSDPEAAPDQQSSEIIGNIPRDEAEFFTVYGCKEEHSAITDVRDFDGAIRVIQHLSTISGLEYEVEC
jgi:hypothetical protein